jgi:ATP-dependent exoDNAse (exonuclease V) beta subunit
VASATDLEDAEIYLERSRASSARASSRISPRWTSLRKLYAPPDLEATDDDLQIMTIHKAKGLEFPPPSSCRA